VGVELDVIFDRAALAFVEDDAFGVDRGCDWLVSSTGKVSSSRPTGAADFPPCGYQSRFTVSSSTHHSSPVLWRRSQEPSIVGIVEMPKLVIAESAIGGWQNGPCRTETRYWTTH
jgi:hypothetical protein